MSLAKSKWVGRWNGGKPVRVERAGAVVYDGLASIVSQVNATEDGYDTVMVFNYPESPTDSNTPKPGDVAITETGKQYRLMGGFEVESPAIPTHLDFRIAAI